MRGENNTASQERSGQPLAFNHCIGGIQQKGSDCCDPIAGSRGLKIPGQEIAGTQPAEKWARILSGQFHPQTGAN